MVISLQGYESLLEAQGGICIICGDSPGERRLVVDRDYETDEIRGLLCRACNCAVDLLKENPNLTRAVAVYLECWEESHAYTDTEGGNGSQSKN